jgi:hypothetical protein
VSSTTRLSSLSKPPEWGAAPKAEQVSGACRAPLTPYFTQRSLLVFLAHQRKVVGVLMCYPRLPNDTQLEKVGVTGTI